MTLETLSVSVSGISVGLQQSTTMLRALYESAYDILTPRSQALHTRGVSSKHQLGKPDNWWAGSNQSHKGPRCVFKGAMLLQPLCSSKSVSGDGSLDCSNLRRQISTSPPPSADPNCSGLPRTPLVFHVLLHVG